MKRLSEKEREKIRERMKRGSEITAEIDKIVKKYTSTAARINQNWYSHEDLADEILEIEESLIESIEEGKKVSIHGGSYLYTPASSKLKLWYASDGSRIVGSLTSILLLYASDLYRIQDPEYIIIGVGRIGQAEFEYRYC